MKYVIKAQRDGWYFKEFQAVSGPPVFGKIQEAKLYVCKKDALGDMVRMGQYGQRVVALTKMGRSNSNGKKSSATTNKV
ncbi:MAG TPA: hypothetical protein VLN72_08810 [Gillisia sp.]|nr:hypothetical protein [Gillisia sp.]